MPFVHVELVEGRSPETIRKYDERYHGSCS